MIEKPKIVMSASDQGELLEFMEEMESKESKELKERGKELLLLWKQCKTADNLDLRRKLAIQFYQKLRWAVTPILRQGETDQHVIDANRRTQSELPGFSDNDAVTDSYIDIILNKGGQLEIGSGTKGERIFFYYRDSDNKLSVDGAVGWMRYPDPTINYSEKYSSVDARIQKRIWWDTFVATFGSNEVDLTADIK